MAPKLCDLLFLSFGHIMTKFQQNQLAGEGVAAVIFQTKGNEIIRDMKIFLFVKNG